LPVAGKQVKYGTAQVAEILKSNLK